MTDYDRIMKVLKDQQAINGDMGIDGYPEENTIDVTFYRTEKLVAFTFDDDHNLVDIY